MCLLADPGNHMTRSAPHSQSDYECATSPASRNSLSGRHGMVLIETERRLAACLLGDLAGPTAMNIVHIPRLSYFWR